MLIVIVPLWFPTYSLPLLLAALALVPVTLAVDTAPVVSAFRALASLPSASPVVSPTDAPFLVGISA